MMICGCGFSNSNQNFDPAIAQFKLMFHMGNTVITVPESPMFNAPEAEVVTSPRLDLIKCQERNMPKREKFRVNYLHKFVHR